MTIIRMLCSPVAVVLAIATCAAGAPVQIQDENIGLNNAVYSQPELAEALARTYEAMEWQRSREREDESGEDRTRNLDHIGGGNLLRNLDHIGGSNLLRNLDHIGGSNLLRNLDQLGGSNLLRNLDHIGGGNLLRGLDAERHANSRSARSFPTFGNRVVDPRKKSNSPAPTPAYQWDPTRGTLDSIGGSNIVRRAISYVNAPELGLEHIGGGDLLREMKTDDKYKMSQTRSHVNEPELRFEYVGSEDLLREMNKDQKYTRS